jgi:hypothetical protein
LYSFYYFFLPYCKGENGHPCLIHDFRGNGFSFLPLSIMLAIGLSYIAFIMSRYIPSIPSLRAFIKKWCWILTKAFSESSDGQVVFVFASINVLYYIYWFVYVEPTLYLGWNWLDHGEWSLIFFFEILCSHSYYNSQVNNQLLLQENVMGPTSLTKFLCVSSEYLEIMLKESERGKQQEINMHMRKMTKAFCKVSVFL